MAKSRIQDKVPFSEGSPCPHCGGATAVGFGLAGGGYGAYTYCEDCSLVVSKSPEVDSPSVPDQGETSR